MIFDFLPNELKKGMVEVWKKMSEKDRLAFIDQVSLLIVLMGQKKSTYKFISKVIETMLKDGSTNLADFGLYIREADPPKDVLGQLTFIDDYRFKHDLPSVPSKNLISIR